jgi:hypothetical protein
MMRGGLRLTAASGGSGGESGGPITVPAVITPAFGSATAGSRRLCGTFKLPPTGAGALAPSQTRDLIVTIGGTELVLHTEAASGRYPNGNLQALRVDADVVFPSNADIVCTVTLGVTRTTSDRSRRTIVRSDVANAAVLLATDPVWLCRSKLTMQQLVPRSTWNAQEEAFFGVMLDQVITTGISGPADTGASLYDYGRPLAAMYCCTGDVQYIKKALEAAEQWYDYFLPVGSDYSSAYAPAGRRIESPFESKSLMVHTYRIAYYITGLGDYWTIGNHLKQQHSRSRGTQAAYLSSVFRESYPEALPGGLAYSGFRFNMRNLVWWTASQYTGQTFDYANPDFVARVSDYTQEIPWAIEALDANKLVRTTALRTNIRGAYDFNLDPSDARWPTTVTWQPGDFAMFQMSITNDWMIDMYGEVFAAGDLILWLKQNMDYVLQQHFLLPVNNRSYVAGANQWCAPYLAYGFLYNPATHYNPALDGDQFSLSDGWLLTPMWIRSLAVLAVAYPSTVVNGATYGEWRDRFMRTQQALPGTSSSWTWKEYGEIAQGLDVPAIRQNGILTGPTTIYQPSLATGVPT